METDEYPGSLRSGHNSVWLRPSVSRAEEVRDIVPDAAVAAASARFERFATVLAVLFSNSGWNGRIKSELIPHAMATGSSGWIKGDHALPMTGSIKARGGVHEVLRVIEDAARASGVLATSGHEGLAHPGAIAAMGSIKLIVASTGNLGYSVGIVARAFGALAEIHMSHDAKAWKKQALRAVGATVVEHACDYTETVRRARIAADESGAHFVDDERSQDLMTGYAVAAAELAAQLSDAGIRPTAARPLVVYLPCGVGGAPGGIALGLKRLLGDQVVCVFVEPTASACVFAAMIQGGERAVDVADYGGNNRTIADGLAVGRASELMLAACGNLIDAVVTVTDADMVKSVQEIWSSAAIRLEPSAAASLAAFAPLLAAASGRQDWPDLSGAHHVFWATGGSRLPDDEFNALLTA